jgi:urease accessory protein
VAKWAQSATNGGGPSVRTAASLYSSADIFAANRATGHIALSVTSAGGRTRRARVFEDGSLRVRFPNAAPESLEAVIVNTGGGMTGGDRFTIELVVGEGASLIAGTAAAEKLYRSNGPDAEMTVRLELAGGARLAWLPQETIMFDNARLSRRTDIDLGPGASLLMAEAVVFGRFAMGEAMNCGLYADSWRVRREGRLIFADGARLDGAIAERLAQSAVTAGGIALATMLIAPWDNSTSSRVLAACEQFQVEVGISSWNGIAVARLCADDAAELHQDLVAVLAAIGQRVPRLWLQ